MSYYLTAVEDAFTEQLIRIGMEREEHSKETEKIRTDRNYEMAARHRMELELDAARQAILQVQKAIKLAPMPDQDKRTVAEIIEYVALGCDPETLDMGKL